MYLHCKAFPKLFMMRHSSPTQFFAAPVFARSSTLTHRKRTAGFSLVEVVLAIGVVAFAFVGIFGLLPSGMTNFRKAMDISVGATIFQKVVDDARQTDFTTLTTPPPNSGGSATGDSFSTGMRYFDEGGDEIIPGGGLYSQSGNLTQQEKNRVVFYVNTRISKVSGVPINDDPGKRRYENSNLATVTVQVANNPAGRDIPIDGTTYLFDMTGIKNMAVTTYSALVAKQD